MSTHPVVPLLSELAPDGFDYSGQYLVEFDADSLWYETSLTIAALALRRGFKTEYHVFEHFPSEARQSLAKLGVEPERLESEGLLDIWDSYTETTEFEKAKSAGTGWETSGDKPLDLVKGAARWVERTKKGFDPKEMRWLHLDDNTGIFLQYNDEATMVDRWRTALLPAVRARECPHFLALPKGIASPAFYTKFEALCDGIIDVKTEEVGGRVERFLRIRRLKGKVVDSRWHRLEVQPDGAVRLALPPSLQPPRRLAAIMFTDMVGSTALAQTDEPLALRLRDEHEALVRPLFTAHQGREIKSMGDGFLAEFDSALRAVQCAVDIQQRLHERNARGGTPPIQVRIGVHLGDVEQREADIVGDAVNIASRIEPLASPGGVCISGEVFSQVRNKIPNRLERLPATRLKGVQVSMDLYRIVLPWTGIESPPTDHAASGLGILPFKNISPDPNDAYFAEGLTEELISVISQVQGLRVISRTSVMQYVATTKSVAQIGGELGVGSILEGSVRKSGNRLRITAQLIDAHSDRHLWTQSYDRNLDDVFAVQTEIAREVAAALAIELRPAEQKRLGARRPVRPDSYLAYLKGRTLVHDSASKEALQAAREQFERAIALDANNAAAYSSLSEVTLMMGWFHSHASPADWIEVGRSLAAKAIELDPSLAEAHATFALVLWDEFDYAPAEEEFLLALSLNPSDSEVHNSFALLLEDEGRTDEAVAALRMAEEADPRWHVCLQNLAHLLTWLGRFDEALLQIQKLGEIDPDSWWYHYLLGEYHLARSEMPRAIEELRRCEDLDSDPRSRSLSRARRYALSGEPDKSRALLRADAALPDQPEDANEIARIYFELGDMDEVFRWLTKSLASSTLAIRGWRLDPRLESVRADPRFLAVLKSVHLA